MKDKHNDILEKIKYGVQLGVAKALDEHKRMGRPVVIWENGKIVHVPAEKIVVSNILDSIKKK